jgi:hypothetical protein
VAEGLAPYLDTEQILDAVEARKWRPEYQPMSKRAG